MSKNRLEQLLENVSQKVDEQHKEVDLRLDNIEKVMIAQEINLKNHMQRSDHLETIVNSLKKDELQPIQRHIAMVEGVVKFIGVLSLLVGIIGGLVKLFGLI